MERSARGVRRGHRRHGARHHGALGADRRAALRRRRRGEADRRGAPRRSRARRRRLRLRCPHIPWNQPKPGAPLCRRPHLGWDRHWPRLTTSFARVASANLLPCSSLTHAPASSFPTVRVLSSDYQRRRRGAGADGGGEARRRHGRGLRRHVRRPAGLPRAAQRVRRGTASQPTPDDPSDKTRLHRPLDRRSFQAQRDALALPHAHAYARPRPRQRRTNHNGAGCCRSTLRCTSR